jgi:hypothetical protein
MGRQRQDNLFEIKEWLIRLERWVEADRFLRHQDSCIELENFFRGLLNLTFEWKLKNANALFDRNQDSFDLSDEANRIAVQVTITTSAQKIRKTLKTFIGTHDQNYDRLVFVYPTFTPGKSQADFGPDLKGYDFEAARDRVCLGTILTAVQDMDVGQQVRILEFLRSELKPLGVAIQMGIDQTVETLIAVIQYMSENVAADAIELNELRPDQKQKVARFSEHASYLLGQYRMNQGLHATIDQARDAIGYDTVRVAKIQTWLKIHSIESLEAHANDATSAFRAIVVDLLNRAHSRGTDAEETAVRFLLADEFIRCNVFPNSVN